VTNRKNGQNSQSNQMCFFMVIALQKWQNFSKLAIKWPIWQPWPGPNFSQHRPRYHGKANPTFSSPTFSFDARKVTF